MSKASKSFRVSAVIYYSPQKWSNFSSGPSSGGEGGQNTVWIPDAETQRCFWQVPGRLRRLRRAAVVMKAKCNENYFCVFKRAAPSLRAPLGFNSSLSI